MDGESEEEKHERQEKLPSSKGREQEQGKEWVGGGGSFSFPRLIIILRRAAVGQIKISCLTASLGYWYLTSTVLIISAGSVKRFKRSHVVLSIWRPPDAPRVTG